MKDISKKVSGLKASPIKVKIPASAMYDFAKMTKITGSVLESLGCPGCHSGFDIRYDIERRLVFNEKLEQVVRG